ncbi:MAG TPA: hypothetical protein VJC14_03245 [Candidatus Paceibacterota bacterium]
MKKTKKGKSISGGKIMALGASAAALGSAAYYFLGPEGRKHQKSAKKWTVEASKKISGELRKAKNLSESLYSNIIDDVVKPYVSRGATATEIAAFTKALKKDWKHIKSTTEKSVKSAVSKAKKTVK